MSVSRSTSVATILWEHVTLEIESIDRMDLNVYAPLLQRAAGVVGFFRHRRSATFASSALISTAFVAALERYARTQGVNKQERLHALARVIFFGRQGRFGDRGYEAQLNRASALSLVINALIVWYTEYLWEAAEELARRGQPVPEEAWAHITPLHWEQVHLVGRYQFDERDTYSGLRPLRRREE